MPQTKAVNEESKTEQRYDKGTTAAVPDRKSQNGHSETRNGTANPNAVKGWNEEQLARGLGWLSLGLGLAQVVAPRGLSKMIGLRGNHNGLFRLLGAREIASGIGILTQRRPAAGAWARVAGDTMDLALLGSAFTLPRSNRGRLAATTAAVAGVTALDVFCSQQLSRRDNARTPGAAMRVEQAVTINRSPEELYQFWRDFKNLPRFMKHLEAVQVSNENRSHWVAKGPAGTTIEWDAEIIEDHPNKVIAWRSMEGADVDNTGSVRFERAPGGRGTTVRVRLQYDPPGGVIGAGVAKLLGEDPEWQVKDDLRRFKQLMETGEIITTEGQSAGRSSSTSWRYDTAVR
jgi:uncharacterized membrane protein